MIDFIEIKRYFPVEREYEAFEEVKGFFIEEWKNAVDLFNIWSLINNLIVQDLKDQEIKLTPLNVESRDKELVELISKSFSELIYLEPVLFRVYLHNSTPPKDSLLRKWLWDNYLPEKVLTRYCEVLPGIFDLLKGSELAKNIILVDGEPAESIPLRFFVVGQILGNLLLEFKHYNLIDLVKGAGAKEEIAELRKNRIYESDEGKVYDYSPLFKKIHGKDKLILEVFTEEDFLNLAEGGQSQAQAADDILCQFIQNTRGDARADELFGQDDTLRYKHIVRYGSQEREIPMQLLPKYKNRIKKKVRRLAFTDLKTKDGDNGPYIRYKEEEISAGIEGLYLGALSWDKDKGPATPHLVKAIEYHLGHTFEEFSTKSLAKERCEKESYEYGTDKFFQERILKEKFESSGGNLDEPINNDTEDSETFKDTIPEKDIRSPEEVLLQKEKDTELDKFFTQYPEMISIIEKEQKGEPLSPRERKIKERSLKKYRKKDKD